MSDEGLDGGEAGAGVSISGGADINELVAELVLDIGPQLNIDWFRLETPRRLVTCDLGGPDCVARGAVGFMWLNFPCSSI